MASTSISVGVASAANSSVSRSSSPSKISTTTAKPLKGPRPSPVLVSSHEEMNPQRRSSMEDCTVYAAPGTWDAPDLDMAFLGLYDGHGGRDMVEYLEYGLSFHIAQELKNHDDDNDDATVLERLERAFFMADIHSRQLGITTSGATVAVCLVHKRPWEDTIRLYCANAGDARIVLGYQGRASRLTKDHRPDDPDEIARIEQAGGFLFKGRVVGVLAVTRSLGDHCMKSFVIAEPFCSETTVSCTGDDYEHDERPSFVICGCDGLWDVFHDQEAVDFVNTYGHQEPDLIAEHLVNEAVRKGSTDNISVMVAWL